VRTTQTAVPDATVPHLPATGVASAADGVQLVSNGKLLVCTQLSYKPFQYKDASNKVVGFDVDIMDLVAKKLGVTQEIVDIDLASIINGAVFVAKKCDASAAAFTITDARKQSIQFSDPYFKATQALLVKKGSGINDLPDLKGKKLGVKAYTTGQKYAEEQKAANGYTTVVYDDSPSELNAALAGNADAVIDDNAVVYDFAKDNAGLEVVKEFDTEVNYGLIVAKGDANATALVAVINDVLKAAKADGTYNTIYKKYFGVDAPTS
jgi:polar amino acid transport system substrate-binding protein